MSKKAAKKAILNPTRAKQKGHAGGGGRGTVPEKNTGGDNEVVQATEEVRATSSKGDSGVKQKKERASEPLADRKGKRTKRVTKPPAGEQAKGDPVKGQQVKSKQVKSQQAKESELKSKPSKRKELTPADKETREQSALTPASVPAARGRGSKGSERKVSKTATERTKADETGEGLQSARASVASKRAKRTTTAIKSPKPGVKQGPAEQATDDGSTSDQDEAPVSFVNSPFAVDVSSTPGAEDTSAPGRKRSGSKGRGKARDARQRSQEPPPAGGPKDNTVAVELADGEATDAEETPEERELDSQEGDAEVATVESDAEDTSDTDGEDDEGYQEQPVPELSEEEARQYLKGLIEALLFSSDKPMTARELARAARLDKKRTQELLKQLRAEYRYRGINLTEVSGGFVLRSNPTYGAFVQKALALRPVRLSRAQLETLAIVAYRQPITRPEIDDIRGVDSGQVLKGLADRDLIKILGKKDEVGRPMLYGTTPAFLELFSLDSLKDLPSLREFTELSDDSREKFAAATGETVSEPDVSEPDLSEPALSEPDGFGEQEAEGLGNGEPQGESDDQPELIAANPETTDDSPQDADASSGSDAVGDESEEVGSHNAVGQRAEKGGDEHAEEERIADDQEAFSEQASFAHEAASNDEVEKAEGPGAMVDDHAQTDAPTENEEPAEERMAEGSGAEVDERTEIDAQAALGDGAEEERTAEDDELAFEGQPAEEARMAEHSAAVVDEQTAEHEAAAERAEEVHAAGSRANGSENPDA